MFAIELPMMSRSVFASMKLAMESDSYPTASGYQKVEKPSFSTVLSKRFSPAPSKRSIGYQTPSPPNGFISNSPMFPSNQRETSSRECAASSASYHRTRGPIGSGLHIPHHSPPASHIKRTRAQKA